MMQTNLTFTCACCLESVGPCGVDTCTAGSAEGTSRSQPQWESCKLTYTFCRPRPLQAKHYGLLPTLKGGAEPHEESITGRKGGANFEQGHVYIESLPRQQGSGPAESPEAPSQAMGELLLLQHQPAYPGYWKK